MMPRYFASKEGPVPSRSESLALLAGAQFFWWRKYAEQGALASAATQLPSTIPPSSDANDSSEDEGELEHHEEEKRPDASKYDGDRARAFARHSAARRRREQVGDDHDDIVAAHERPSAGIPGTRGALDIGSQELQLSKSGGRQYRG
jgi:hypothetical protein